ncbi:MAG: GNAT family N-acetyltransferase [Prochlorococcaceae cyanobacterium]
MSSLPDPAAAASDPARLTGQRLGPEHLEACLALDADCLGGLWSRSQWQRELIEPDRLGQGLFTAAGELAALACGWLVLDELQITVVGVRRAWQRQGLGRRVLAALLAEGRRRGAGRATLEVAAANSAGQALYASAGFRTAGRRRGYYRNGDEALIQWLQLTVAK